MLIKFWPEENGIQRGELDLSKLYSDKKDRENFERKWGEFMPTDPAHQKIFYRNGDILCFQTESLIPTKIDDRPSALLLFGNAASESVPMGMCFSFEGSHKEHRIWKAFRDAEFLRFRSDDSGYPFSLQSNHLRNKEFYNLEYSSPFRYGISVFYSIPSPANAYGWAGVSGLRKLFGAQALRMMESEEKQRIRKIICNFMGNDEGAIFAFQRDAYEGIRSSDAPEYSVHLAKQGSLRGESFVQNALVACVPPTRFAAGKAFRIVLTLHKSYILQKLLRSSDQTEGMSEQKLPTEHFQQLPLGLSA